MNENMLEVFVLQSYNLYMHANSLLYIVVENCDSD